ncbi:15026_t:CDS:2, partial [Cetraspora pellucida]
MDYTGFQLLFGIFFQESINFSIRYHNSVLQMALYYHNSVLQVALYFRPSF